MGKQESPPTAQEIASAPGGIDAQGEIAKARAFAAKHAVEAVQVMIIVMRTDKTAQYRMQAAQAVLKVAAEAQDASADQASAPTELSQADVELMRQFLERRASDR